MDAPATRTFRAMGTTCRIAATGAADPGEPEAAIAAARAEIARCERALSRFEAASDLSRVNAGVGEWVEVGAILAGALAAALRAREDTGGLYDPTVLPALMAAGYDRSFDQLVAGTPRAPAPLGHWRAAAPVELDAERLRVRFAERGARSTSAASARAIRRRARSRPCERPVRGYSAGSSTSAATSPSTGALPAAGPGGSASPIPAAPGPSSACSRCAAPASPHRAAIAGASGPARPSIT